MKVLASNLTGATRVKDSQGMSRNFSKVVTLGNSYRLFFPLQEDEHGAKDILIAAVPGRKLNYNKLNRSFIALSDFDVSETGRITDKSGLAPYARISKVLHDAECAAEKAKADKDAKQTAEDMGKQIDHVALRQAHREIELRYNGDRDAKPSAIYPEESPMISGVTVEIATEVLVVPLNSNKEAEWGKAVIAALPISGRKAAQLTSLVANPDYCNKDNSYLEVAYDYSGTDKRNAGINAVFQGVSAEVSLKRKYPESWEANQDALGRLASSAEMIAAKNMTMSSNTTTREVIELFLKYVSKHELILLYLDYEDDMVKATAKDMLDLNIASNAPKVQSRLIELVELQNEAVENEETYISNDVIKASEATTIAQLQDKVENIDQVIGGDIDDL